MATRASDALLLLTLLLAVDLLAHFPSTLAS
jgi:hypothetical protein